MNDRSWFLERADARPALTRRAGRPGLVNLKSATASLLLLALGALGGSACSGYDKQPTPADQAALAGEETACLNGPSQGDRCTKDCVTTCQGGSATKVCTCEGGVFISCPCLPPDGWPYPPGQTAPWCDAITGHPLALRNETCEVDGLSCISTQAPEQGCRCELTADAARLAWNCGNAGTMGIPSDATTCESLGNGLIQIVQKTDCTPWQICVARNYDEGSTTPRGCVCVPEGGAQVWRCGSTNRWFRPE